MNALQWAGLVGLCVGVGITWRDRWTARTERHLRRLVADCCRQARADEDDDLMALVRATQDPLIAPEKWDACVEDTDPLWTDFERTRH